MQILTSLFWLFIFLNSALAIFTVFREKERDIAAIWAWLLVITMLPGVGIIIYLFLGRKISRENIFDIRAQKRICRNSHCTVDFIETCSQNVHSPKITG